jgi:hypothetical protein
MEKQNITLTLPKDILLKVKLIAVKRQTSVSGLLTKTLEKVVQQEDAFVHAQRRHLQWLEKAEDLGSDGKIMVSRDELHERG